MSQLFLKLKNTFISEMERDRAFFRKITVDSAESNFVEITLSRSVSDINRAR